MVCKIKPPIPLKEALLTQATTQDTHPVGLPFVKWKKSATKSNPAQTSYCQLMRALSNLCVRMAPAVAGALQALAKVGHCQAQHPLAVRPCRSERGQHHMCVRRWKSPPGSVPHGSFATVGFRRGVRAENRAVSPLAKCRRRKPSLTLSAHAISGTLPARKYSLYSCQEQSESSHAKGLLTLSCSSVAARQTEARAGIQQRRREQDVVPRRVNCLRQVKHTSAHHQLLKAAGFHGFRSLGSGPTGPMKVVNIRHIRNWHASLCVAKAVRAETLWLLLPRRDPMSPHDSF